jgi:cytochrome c oxidase subunit 1
MVFFNMIFLPQFNLGLMGHHRRIAVPTVYEFLSTPEALNLQHISTLGTYLLLAAQVPFIFNFFYSMFKGEIASANPWGATTLEWACPSPPPHGNFEKQPVVYHDPYVYSPPDREADFVPQNEPIAGVIVADNPLVETNVAK